MKLALAVLALVLAVGVGWMLRPLPSTPPTSPESALKWTLAKAQASDGKPHILRIAQQAQSVPERASLVWRLEVTSTLAAPTAEGLPGKDVLAQLAREEHALVAAIPGRYVLSDTGSGKRVLTFYVADPSTASATAQAVSPQLKVFTEKDEAWEAYPRL